ncbi:MAG TPA: hypothetical protein VGP04_22110 [Pseudonocardiaceae bacterium]|jgi:hypothetical protein|nr:hypothetical protein [Pseudonocardiaceae bacterium]
MAQRLVRFSDLTNKMIQDDEVVRIVIEQHPALQNGPVELEAAPDEVEAIRTSVLNVVSLKLYQDDSTSPEIVTMEIEAFNRLAGDMDMEDVLRKAQPAHTPRKPTRPAAASAADKLDYTSLEHAGKPHRGKTTDAEKEIVRNNFDKINERLERDGLRVIRLDDAEMVARYGLDDLAKEAGPVEQ